MAHVVSVTLAREVLPLPYAYNALEPYIDEHTMHVHHDKHHAAYLRIHRGQCHAPLLSGGSYVGVQRLPGVERGDVSHPHAGGRSTGETAQHPQARRTHSREAAASHTRVPARHRDGRDDSGKRLYCHHPKLAGAGGWIATRIWRTCR